MVPSKSTSIVITCGCSVCGGGVPTGMFKFTACNWIGIVMISITRSTSITSINGVVLISIITSCSWEPPLAPTFIAMVFSSQSARRRLGHEADLLNPGALTREHDATDELIAPRQVAADVHFGLRLKNGRFFQTVDELLVVADQLQAPINVAIFGDGELDVLGLGLAR